MKKLAFLLMLVLGSAWTCHAQSWTYLQDSLATGCSPGASSCYIPLGNMLPTTPGSVWVVEVQTASNVTISSVTGGGGWTLCPASSCHLFSSARNVDMAYSLTGPAGTSSITVNLSGGSGSIFGANFFEFLPPAGSAASFDAAGGNVSANCTTACPGVSLPISGTDLILQDMHANSASSWNAWSSPYTTLPLGEGLYLNATSGTAPTVATSGVGAVVHAIAFKSTAGTFTPPPEPISVVNFTNISGIFCGGPATHCLLNIPSTGAGHLLYVEAADLFSGYISSISGGGTWVIPTGANTCRTSLSPGYALSCGYVLSSSSGVTQLDVLMTGSASTFFDVWELASTSGPFSFDTQGSSANAPSREPTGQALTLSGGNDVIFQSLLVPGGTSAVTLYPMPRIPSQGTQFLNNNAACAALLNTTDGAAPHWADEQNNSTAATGVAFSTGAGASRPAPPTNLAAVVH